MSIEAVNQFLTKVNKDEKLQAELSQAMSRQNNRQATVELAAKHGYDFTTEELDKRIEQIQSIQAKQAANQELNESELEAVSGGGDLENLAASLITAMPLPGDAPGLTSF